MKLKILKDSRHAPFQGRDGEKVDYYWTKAERLDDGITIEFGGKEGYRKDDIIEATIEKTEVAGGFRYKEI